MNLTSNRLANLRQARLPALQFAFAMAFLLCLGLASPAKAANNAAFVSQSVPEVMVPGQVYAVSVTMQNTGNTTWSEANSFRLGSQNPQDNSTWGMGRVYLSGTVAPGTSTTFNFNVTAPSTAGVYNFQWKMVRDGVGWFGAQSANVAVGVNGTNDSQFISQTVPGIMSPAQSYAVSVTLQNTGTATWTTGSYFLGSENPEANTTWGLNRVDLTAPVAAGANATLNFNVTAPSTAGMYNFQWRMVQNSTRFGAFTTNVAVNVQQGQAMALYYVHADHLNTPRLVADATGTTVWRWDQQEPFGNNPADEDPDANSVAFDLPLRLPGQRYDQETGLHYNYFRDYDAGLGRYLQSDPAGLVAGLHTFAYVSSRPLTAVDPFGLQANEPRDGLDPLIACKLIGRDPKPDICVDEAKCFDTVLKALTKCQLQYWFPKKKIACITCWRYIEGLCPGLNPGPECDGLACIVPSIAPDPEIPTLGV